MIFGLPNHGQPALSTFVDRYRLLTSYRNSELGGGWINSLDCKLTFWVLLFHLAETFFRSWDADGLLISSAQSRRIRRRAYTRLVRKYNTQRRINPETEAQSIGLTT